MAMGNEESTAIALKSNIETQITSLELFLDDMTFSHPSKEELMEMKGYLNHLTARLDEIITPEPKVVSDTNCTQLIGTKENFEMVLKDIEKILDQIEVIGVTGNNEVDTYLADLKIYYIGVESDVTSTISALQQRISSECADLTSAGTTSSLTSHTSVSINATNPGTSSESTESGLPTSRMSTTRMPTSPTTTDEPQLTTEGGHLQTTRDGQHVLTTKDGQHVLTTRDGHHLLTTRDVGHNLLTTSGGHNLLTTYGGELLTTRHGDLLTTEVDHPLLTTNRPEKLTTEGGMLFTTRGSKTSILTITTTTSTTATTSTLPSSLTTAGLCCRVKTVTSGSLQGRY